MNRFAAKSMFLIVTGILLCSICWADGNTSGVKSFFPFGIWYQGCLTDKGITEPTMAEDIRALGLNFAIANADTNLAPDSPDPRSLRSMLDLADRLGLKMLVGLAPLVKVEICGGITTPEEFDKRREELKAKLAPFVAEGRKHPSLFAWWCGDEPIASGVEKVKAAEKLRQLFMKMDPDHTSFCEGPWTVVERDVIPHIQNIHEPVYMPEVYPFWNGPYKVGVGDFRCTGFKYPAKWDRSKGNPKNDEWVRVDIVDHYREVRSHIGGRAMWPWLAAFRDTTTGEWFWRAPTPVELRCQAWIAVAEGCRGLAWFGYEYAVLWGDYASLFPEIKSVISSIRPLTDILLDCRVSENVATVSGGGSRYYKTALVETLRDSAGTAYLVVVNRNCEETGNSRVSVKAKLPSAVYGTQWLAVDPATNAIITVGASSGISIELDMRPGDGRLIRLINSSEIKPVIEPDVKSIKVGESIEFKASGGVSAVGPAFYRWSVTGYPAGTIDPMSGVFTSKATGRCTIWCRDAAGNSAFTREVIVQ